MVKAIFKAIPGQENYEEKHLEKFNDIMCGITPSLRNYKGMYDAYPHGLQKIIKNKIKSGEITIKNNVPYKEYKLWKRTH